MSVFLTKKPSQSRIAVFMLIGILHRLTELCFALQQGSAVKAKSNEDDLKLMHSLVEKYSGFEKLESKEGQVTSKAPSSEGKVVVSTSISKFERKE